MTTRNTRIAVSHDELADFKALKREWGFKGESHGLVLKLLVAEKRAELAEE